MVDRTPSCGRPTPLGHAIVARLDDATIAVAVPAALIGEPSSVGWFSSTESAYTYDVDEAPEGGYVDVDVPARAVSPPPAPAPVAAPAAPVVSAPITSPGASGVVGSVTRLYSAYFLRAPDAGGLAYWLDRMHHGTTLAWISEQFARSAEFTARYGALDAGAFVQLVYRNVLGREPDAGGYAHWAPLVHNGSLTRGQMMIGFSESAEYRALTQTS